MPPRHGKTELIGKHFPLWCFDRFQDDPTWRFTLTSYSSSFAAGWGGQARDLCSEHSASLGFGISPSVRAGSEWRTTTGQTMYSTGVDGALTGLGANVLVVDDPIPNWEKAYSRAYRDKVWAWYLSTAYTRLEPGGSIIVVQTRWHDDDLVGRLLREMAKGGDQWEVITFPAIAEAGDPLGRAPGEPLWAERYSLEDLRAIELAVGPFVWAGLFQQRPRPAGGLMFAADRWRYYLFPPPLHTFDRIIQSWDMSFEDARTSDYVCGGVWGIRQAEAYLLDLVRDRMSFDRAVRAVRDMCALYPTSSGVFVEKAANGAAIVSHLEREIPGLIAVPPVGSKEARAAAVQPFQVAGNIYIPHPDRVRWAAGFVAELEAFPNGENDDQVDMFSLALAQAWLTGGLPPSNVQIVLETLRTQSRFRR